jgi:membrane-associated protease RseP (regulator of RpoE activity)
VLVAGSTMHFVIALGLLFVLLVGWPSVVHGAGRVASVETCMSPASDGSCPAGVAAVPAKGKLLPDDVITAVDGHPVVHGSAQVVKLTSHAPSGPITFTVQRAGKALDVVINPVVVDGKARVGIELNDAKDATYHRASFSGVVTGTFKTFGTLFVGSFKALGTVPHEVGQLFHNFGAPRKVDPNSGGGQVTSVVGVAQFAGEAFKAAGFSGGVATLIGIVASVNIFVGIFNLFPFLPLDGGHVAILGYEKVRNAWRRRRHLVPAGPVDLNKLMPFTYGVLAIIVTVSALILFADIANPVANPFSQ